MTAEGVSPAFVDRLLRVTEEQAEATGRIAVMQQSQAETLRETRVLQERQTATLDRISETLSRIEADQREGRAAAVSRVEKHIAEAIRAAGPPKLIGWIIAGGVALASAALTALATLRGVRHE